MSLRSGVAWGPSTGGPISVRIPLDDLSRVGEARRAADLVARGCGLDDDARARLAVVTTEAATNLARHAKQGAVYLRDTEPSGLTGVEVLAVDCGPGMHDVSRFFTDGFSTGGTPGTGLGAMQRMSGEFDIFSQPGSGTALVARVFQTAENTETGHDKLLDVGVVCRPLEPEQTCGDGWLVVQTAERAMVLVVDGLGHGPAAAEAADVARATFRAVSRSTPAEALVAVHEAMRGTRGGALAIAEVAPSADGATVTMSGAGNISASVVAPLGSKSLPSMNGTAGLQLRGVREFTAELPLLGVLIFHSDGLNARWKLDAYPGILRRDPALVAALLHRDFSRGRDDATVLALRLRPRGP